MKKSTLWPGLALLGGVVAAVLRGYQMYSGFETGTGLAVPGNLWGRLLPLWLLLLAIVSLVLSRRVPAGVTEKPSLRAAFPPEGRAILPLPATLAWLVSSAVTLMQARTEAVTDGYEITYAAALFRADLLSGGIVVLSAVCLFCAMMTSPQEGRRSDGNGVLLVIPVAALVIRLVLLYRELSVNPALQAYYLPLLALAALCLALYEAGSFAFGNGRSRRFLPVTVMGVVLSLGAAAEGGLANALFYLGSACYLLELLRLHRPQENPNPAPKADA